MTSRKDDVKRSNREGSASRGKRHNDKEVDSKRKSHPEKSKSGQLSAKKSTHYTDETEKKERMETMIQREKEKDFAAKKRELLREEEEEKLRLKQERQAKKEAKKLKSYNYKDDDVRLLHQEESSSYAKESRKQKHEKKSKSHDIIESRETEKKHRKQKESVKKNEEAETSRKREKKDSKSKHYRYEEIFVVSLQGNEKKTKEERRKENSEASLRHHEKTVKYNSHVDESPKRKHSGESHKSSRKKEESKPDISPLKQDFPENTIKEASEANVIEEETVEKRNDSYDNDYDYADDFEDYSDDFDESLSEPHSKENEDDNVRIPSATEKTEVEKTPTPPSPREDLHRGSVNNDQQDITKTKSNKPYNYGIVEITRTNRRHVSKEVKSKLIARYKELRKLIVLDTDVDQEVFEMSPISQYELYISSFGRANYKQAFVQTGDDSIDRDIQTEETEMVDKWTQYPPSGHDSAGGNQLNHSEVGNQISKTEFDSVRLNKFLFHATRVMSVLLEEELPDNNLMVNTSENSSQLAFCTGYFTLSICPLFGKQSVMHCCCSSTNFTDFLMTVHNDIKMYKAQTKDNINGRNFLGVWDLKQPSKPAKILSSESQISCCCFGPSSSKLTFAGCVDGSILVWDTREAESLHQSIHLDGVSYTVRHPAYNTAGLMMFTSHHAPVQSICHVPRQSYNLKDSRHLSLEPEVSFQLLSMDCIGHINIWVIVELTSVQAHGSLTELGLRPGSKVKLVQSSTLSIQSPLRDPLCVSGIQTHQLCLLPENPNQIYIATDTGHIVHSVRLGSIPYPRVHYPQKMNGSCVLSEVLSIDFSPFKLPCFLTGYSDGNIHLYHTNRECAINSWPLSMTGISSITQVRWSKTRPCVFYAIADHSVVFVFDLLQQHNKPVHKRTIENRITAMEIFCHSDDKSHTIPNERMILCLSSGKIEIQTISASFSQPQDLEWEFLEKYLERS
ncbi:WD repeat-containing protein 60 isoform X3 [Octopus sinensis]|uniref:WD repeat-containing protein 60 isoform X3 n=1 Tax=Octopus sinensis TaxID=2607531 RepID=A0A7E6FEF3_9MOLL|nr:WD repeat-containing protein 60 isoform X3 [Octopus sinensis]